MQELQTNSVDSKTDVLAAAAKQASKMSVALDSAAMDSQQAQLNLLLYQIYKPYMNGKKRQFRVNHLVAPPEEERGKLFISTFFGLERREPAT